MTKKLYKSVTDRKLAGVCGGLAEYFDCDSTLVRLAVAIIMFCGGVGIVPYILAAIILNDNPGDYIGE